MKAKSDICSYTYNGYTYTLVIPKESKSNKKPNTLTTKQVKAKIAGKA
jgi:hypothetical protein